MSILKNIGRFVLIISILWIVSCKSDKKQDAIGNDKNLNKTDSWSEVTFENKNKKHIYDVYLQIKGGLVNGDSEKVQAAAQKMTDILDDSEQNKQLKATSKLISVTKDIKKQRDFFVTITDEVFTLVSNSKIVSGEIYKQYCPMAFDGQGGYWLSNSEEIRNPYFGNQMR